MQLSAETECQGRDQGVDPWLALKTVQTLTPESVYAQVYITSTSTTHPAIPVPVANCIQPCSRLNTKSLTAENPNGGCAHFCVLCAQRKYRQDIQRTFLSQPVSKPCDCALSGAVASSLRNYCLICIVCLLVSLLACCCCCFPSEICASLFTL